MHNVREKRAQWMNRETEPDLYLLHRITPSDIFRSDRTQVVKPLYPIAKIEHKIGTLKDTPLSFGELKVKGVLCLNKTALYIFFFPKEISFSQEWSLIM